MKPDEAGRFRLIRIRPAGAQQVLDVGGDLRLTYRPLVPGAIRGGRLLLPVAVEDSWFWHVGVLDLRRHSLVRLGAEHASDVHLVTFAADGRILALGLGIETSLWRSDPDE